MRGLLFVGLLVVVSALVLTDVPYFFGDDIEGVRREIGKETVFGYARRFEGREAAMRVAQEVSEGMGQLPVGGATYSVFGGRVGGVEVSFIVFLWHPGLSREFLARFAVAVRRFGGEEFSDPMKAELIEATARRWKGGGVNGGHNIRVEEHPLK